MSRSRSRTVIGLLVFVVGTALSCGGDDGTSPVTRCAQDLTSITVAVGEAPQFTWNPACGVNELVVRDVETSEVMWRVAGENRDIFIKSGIRYGTVAEGISEFDGPFDLLNNRTYIVVLYREGVDGLDPIGSKEWMHGS